MRPAEYHQLQTLSRSQLWRFCCNRQKYGLQLQGDMQADATSEAFLIGNAIDTLVTSPESFPSEYYVSNEKIDRRTKVGKARAVEIAIDSAGKIVLDEDDYARVRGAADAVAKHGWLGTGFFEQVSQVFVEGELHGIPCRVLLDFVRDGETIIDLKSTSDASPKAFANSIRKFGYDFQAAFYQRLWNADKEYPHSTPYWIVAVESKPPHRVGVYKIAAVDIVRAANRVDVAMQNWRLAMLNNDWQEDWQRSPNDIWLPDYEKFDQQWEVG
jgi:hypothetical protein